MASRLTWGLQQVRVQQAWEEGYSGDGVRVGHLDTGVDAGHPALKGRLADFARFDRTGDRLPGVRPTDTNGHGTHTAGIICGGEWDSVRIGVAPGAKLVSARVMEEGSVIARIMFGMEWMLQRDIRILSVSAGIPCHSTLFQPMIETLRSRGILPIFPVGNLGAGRSHSPGNYRSLLSVGSTGRSGRVAKFSGSLQANNGLECLKPDLVAPGAEISSAAAGGGLSVRSGTSMASAFVAGMAALLMQAEPDAPIDAVELALTSGTRRLLSDQSHRCRGGIIDAPEALRALRREPRGKALTSADKVRSARTTELENTVRVDPFLAKQVRISGGELQCEAIIVTDPQPAPQTNSAVREAARSLIERSGRNLRERPRRIRYLPSAKAVVVEASGRFISRLLEEEEVIVAHSATVDRGQNPLLLR